MQIKLFSSMSLAAGILAACAHASEPAVAASPERTLEPSFDDVFNLVIETERWGVMIDNALSGGIAAAMAEAGEARGEIYRVDYALRSGARQLIALRDSLCIDRISPEATCQPIELPDWVGAAPDVEGTSFAEYQARSQWLGEAIQPFVAAGCEAGRDATTDDMFCAVE